MSADTILFLSNELREARERIEHLELLLEPVIHRARHDYNKWSQTRDKKNTYSYVEAMDRLRTLQPKG